MHVARLTLQGLGDLMQHFERKVLFFEEKFRHELIWTK
jgi:hypothetical protein